MGICSSPDSGNQISAFRFTFRSGAFHRETFKRAGLGFLGGSHALLRGGFMVDRIVVGAHYGLKQWLGQRFTALVLVAYVIFFAVRFSVLNPCNFLEWRQVFEPSWMRIWTLLVIFSLFYHVWVGVRDIFMDYIGQVGVRLGLQAAVVVVLLGYSVWTVEILWSF